MLQQAQKSNKPILALETLNEQIDAIDKAPLSAQIAAISLSLSQLEQGGDELKQLAHFWQQGDHKSLYALNQQNLKEEPELAPLMSTLIDQRNQRMATRIQVYLEQGGRYLVVVGALHVSGPNSIQNILKKKGYSFTPTFEG